MEISTSPTGATDRSGWDQPLRLVDHQRSPAHGSNAGWQQRSHYGNAQQRWVFNFVAGVNDSSFPVQTATQSLSITITQNIYGNGPGGPILVLANTANPFSTYYAEILLAEGLNEFALEDIRPWTVEPCQTMT